MKTVFIINPVAGKGKETDTLISKIKALLPMAEIYITKSEGNAREYVKQRCMSGEEIRFIACGGDGTLSETVNGVIGFEKAQAGVLPIGTGNDFVRNFECDFKNIVNQERGKVVKCDLIKYRFELDSRIKEGFAVNMLNIGFDCKVADMTAEVKKKSLLSGPIAYFVSIFLALVKKECSELKIEADGELIYKGKLLLTSLANGCYCGGGIKSNPYASVQDGLININIIRDLSRTRFISLLPSYMKGTFLDIKGIEKYVLSGKYKKITVTPLKGNIRISADGEIMSAGKTEFEIIHNGFNFVVPLEFSDGCSDLLDPVL